MRNRHRRRRPGALPVPGAVLAIFSSRVYPLCQLAAAAGARSLADMQYSQTHNADAPAHSTCDSEFPVLSPKMHNVRHALMERRAALLADLRQAVHDAHSGADIVQPDDAPDDLDAGAVRAESGIRFSVMHMKGEMLGRIDEALARVDDGRYGICEACGSDISDARLRALPFALRCTHCEEERERDQKHADDLSRAHRFRQERRDYMSGWRGPL